MRTVILACLLAPVICLAGTGIPQTPEEVDAMYAEFLGDCIDPYKKAKDEAYEAYEEALYSGKMGKAEHAKRNLEIFSALNDAEAEYKRAKSTCRIAGIAWLDEIEKKIVEESLREIEEFLQNLTQSLEPIQCVADGSIIECRDVEGEIVPIPDGIRM